MRHLIQIAEHWSRVEHPDVSQWTAAQIIAYAAEVVLKTNPGKTPFEINRGQCDEFPDLVESVARDRFESLELGDFHRYEDNFPVGFDEALLAKWPDIQPWPCQTWDDMFHKHGMNWTGTHVWSYCAETGLHYDIETLEGVKNPFDLKFFDTWPNRPR